MATTVELLNFNNKQENNGVNNRGRLTANEFNQVVDAINANTSGVSALTEQLANKNIRVLESEDAYEQLAEKDNDTIYFILEEE
jgi:hypothetical protein